MASSKIYILRQEYYQLVTQPIDNRGIKYLSRGNFPKLERLNVGMRRLSVELTELDDKGAKIISVYPYWPSLINLYFTINTKITDLAIEHVTKAYFP